MIELAIKGLITISICAITVSILYLVHWTIKKIISEMMIMQGEEIRRSIEDFTTKIVKIQIQMNGGIVHMNEAQAMLADAMREAGLDPGQYYMEGLILSKAHDLNAKTEKE